MRKEWQKPVLEVLDVNMTMASAGGKYYDANYSHDHEIPTDPITGEHLDSKYS